MCCLLWEAVAGPRPAAGCETPLGLAMCCPRPHSPAVPVPLSLCRWGLSCGHQLLLLCFWAFHFSHDPFVLPTVCALPFFFFFLKKKHKRFLLASLLLFKRAVFLNTLFFFFSGLFFIFYFYFLIFPHSICFVPKHFPLGLQPALTLLSLHTCEGSLLPSAELPARVPGPLQRTRCLA